MAPIVAPAEPAEPSRRDDDADGGGTIAAELERGAVAQRFARARLLADAPSAIADNDPGRGDSAVMRAPPRARWPRQRRASWSRRRTSFPAPTAWRRCARRAPATCASAVMTNSLATTDEPLVHFGYARYRLDLLRLGVSLHELMPMPDAARRERRRASRRLARPAARQAGRRRRPLGLDRLDEHGSPLGARQHRGGDRHRRSGARGRGHRVLRARPPIRRATPCACAMAAPASSGSAPTAMRSFATSRGRTRARA